MDQNEVELVQWGGLLRLAARSIRKAHRNMIVSTQNLHFEILMEPT
jgi:hypothetical protein